MVVGTMLVAALALEVVVVVLQVIPDSPLNPLFLPPALFFFTQICTDAYVYSPRENNIEVWWGFCFILPPSLPVQAETLNHACELKILIYAV